MRKKEIEESTEDILKDNKELLNKVNIANNRIKELEIYSLEQRDKISLLEESYIILKKEVDILKANDELANSTLLDDTDGSEDYENDKFNSVRFTDDGESLIHLVNVTDEEYKSLSPNEIYSIKVPYYYDYPSTFSSTYILYKVVLSKCLKRITTPIISKFSNDNGVLKMSGMAIANTILIIYNDDKIIGDVAVDDSGIWRFEWQGFKLGYIISAYSMDKEFKISKETKDLVIGKVDKKQIGKPSILKVWKNIITDEKMKIKISNLK